jgi:hypothetical protein
MKETYCPWCFKKKKQEEPDWFEFPEKSGFFFCSKQCLSHAMIKRGGIKYIDFEKIRKHSYQIRRERNRAAKSRLMASLSDREKLSNEDLAALFSCLTPKQKTALAMIGLAHVSWSVHGNPKQLKAEVEKYSKALKGN